MKIMESIKENKEQILQELYQWAETFNPENILYNQYGNEEEDEKELNETYKFVLGLAERLHANLCTNKDYEDILFHVEQINYNEMKIHL